ncbi:kinase family with ARM repeat domain-containing protein [Actinidia rufa]|uniref:non-specific serine/threonine protein kinase n=1 Tax=Actinidia rufa TaxID=165716 RepID=A0A7J0G0D3_9ERIC|nr:kinase family with ARM repeat domain-containing protein [Actinidia rufa]
MQTTCTMKLIFNKDQDILISNQSLRILLNLVAAGAVNSSGVLDEIIHELLGFTTNIVNLKSPDVSDIIAMVIGCTDDASGRILCESTACVAVMLSRVAQGLEASRATLATEVVSAPSMSNEILKQVLDHAKISGLADLLFSCLATSGSSLMSGSSHLLRAACEACRAIWSLTHAFEILFMKENAYLLPLNALRSHSLHRLDIRDHAQGSLVVTESEKIVDALTKAFLRSKATQVAIYYCLRQRLEAALSSAIQIMLRCCAHSGIVCGVLCGLPSSLPVTTVVSGGGDGTIISEVFTILTSCASSSNKDPQTEAVNVKCKIANPSLLVLHSCLVIATVAQCLKSSGRNSALFMLTTSSKKQLSRLSVLAHHFSSDDRTKISFQLHCVSAMLALASILSLESGTPSESSISETAVPLIPQTASLCDYLKILPVGENGVEAFIQNVVCASGIPQLLIDLLAKSHSDASQGIDCTNDHLGLSPVGSENIKLISDLISDTHLKLVRLWTGPGGRQQDGIRDIINAVIDLLAFPFVAVQSSPGLPSATASVNSGFLLNMGSPGGKVCMEDKDMVGVPGIILRCLEHMELKDVARPVAFLAKMTGHQPLSIQLLGKGLLDPGRVRRLLGSSCPKEVIMDVLMIISDLARMDKVFYEYINGADMLEFLKDFLTHEDPNVRAKACSAIGNMGKHSFYFYSSLLGNAAYHNDLLYEELRRSIPQLANLLLSAEEDKTKANAAGALSNLVRNSNKLCADIVSKGALQVCGHA